jgi:threonine dehydratase
MNERDRIEAARRIVRDVMPPTPQQRWPLLDQRVGAQVWVKHENHTAVGAFKLRGGLVYVDALRRREPAVRGVISATRGNHGQSVGFAARRHGLTATIVVPHGNSREKNAAMRALGVELIEHGDDFQAAREHAAHLAHARGLHMVPAFHYDLVGGVATCWIEFFESFARGAVATLLEWEGRHPCDALPDSGVALERLALARVPPAAEALYALPGVQLVTDGPPLAAVLSTPRGRVELRSPDL